FVAYDFGARADSLRQLAALGGRVTLVPFDTPAEAVLELKPDAFFLSSGPGDPAGLSESVAAVRTLSEKLPVLAFGLGFQVLCLALGAAAFRMKTGHYGLNQPVQDLAGRRCLSTSQCHSLAIDPASLGPGLQVTHLNLNDRTVEGVRHRERPLAGLQYYPANDDPIFETFAGFLNA
ncbi:MAG TPA: carbamoyl phosphate synthase small subunit, partial [bacterium]|nr:carbamoyl phosphate synthase small subunit [bacterium]